MIWSHYMKDIVLHDRFTLVGAPTEEFHEYGMDICSLVTSVHLRVHNPAITVGAGVQWHEVYSTLDAVGRMMIGDVSNGGSVGSAGGWILNGGHSNLPPSYGLGT